MEQDLEDHMRLLEPCKVVQTTVDPEDGITFKIDELLSNRKRAVSTWEQLWEVLFPEDKELPSSGEFAF